MKRTKTRTAALSCPKCGRKTIHIDYCALTGDYIDRFRLFCPKKDFFGAWRKSRNGALNAWNAGKSSEPNSVGDEI